MFTERHKVVINQRMARFVGDVCGTVSPSISLGQGVFAQARNASIKVSPVEDTPEWRPMMHVRSFRKYHFLPTSPYHHLGIQHFGLFTLGVSHHT